MIKIFFTISKCYYSTTRKNKIDPWINPPGEDGDDPNNNNPNWNKFNSHMIEVDNILELQQQLALLLKEATNLNKQLNEIQKRNKGRMRDHVDQDHLIQQAHELASRIRDKRDAYEAFLKRIKVSGLGNIHNLKLTDFCKYFSDKNNNLLTKVVQRNLNDINVMIRNLRRVQHTITTAEPIYDNIDFIDSNSEDNSEDETSNQQETAQESTQENRSRFYRLYDTILSFALRFKNSLIIIGNMLFMNKEKLYESFFANVESLYSFILKTLTTFISRLFFYLSNVIKFLINVYTDNTDISNICIFLFIMALFIYGSVVKPTFLSELPVSIYNIFMRYIRIVWNIINTFIDWINYRSVNPLELPIEAPDNVNRNRERRDSDKRVQQNKDKDNLD